MKTLVAVLLFALQVYAQDQAEAARAAAGCGPNDVQFSVKRDKSRHPVAQPEAGKALVYFFGDEDRDQAGLHIGGITTRWGIDGTWAGANDRNSYFFVSVTPGEHKVCTRQQSKIYALTKNSAALTFTAEAGKAYYFRTRTPVRQHRTHSVELEAVDPAAAQLLIADSAFSVSQRKEKSGKRK